MKNNFRIRICSDLDYEELVADICYDNYKIATIMQDKGKDNMEIEIFFSVDENESWKFPLNDFMEAISIAKKQLIEVENNNIN